MRLPGALGSVIRSWIDERSFSAPLKNLGIALATCALVLVARDFGVFDDAELAWYDLQTTWHAGRVDMPSAVAVVDIAPDTTAGLSAWPIADQDLAAALDKISGGGAAAIGLHFYRPQPLLPGVGKFNASCSTATNPVALSRPRKEGGFGIDPPSCLSADGHHGFQGLVQDRDRSVRRIALFEESTQGLVSSFAMQLASRLLERTMIGDCPK